MGLSRTVSEIDSDFSRKSQKKIHTPCILCPAEGVPLGIGYRRWGSENHNDRATGSANNIFSRLDTMHQRDRRTDRHGRQQRPRLRIASRGKNSNALCGDANPCRLERHSCSIWHHTFEGVLLATIGVDYYIIFRCQNYSIN